MVQILKLDHLEYKEAILDSPEFREKLKKHEKHIADTNKNIKLLLKKFEDVLNASEALRNAQDAFSVCLREFQIGFVGDTNEEESDIVDTLECTYNLFQDVKEFSTKMINTGHTLIKQMDNFRKEKLDTFKEKKKDYERQTIRYCSTLEKYLQSSQYSKKDKYSDECSSDFKENDRAVRDENNQFYFKCLDYVLCIQEFEEKWVHFFAESIFAFVQSWTAFFHEGYDKHNECENRFSKSQGGIQALAHNFEYFKIKSTELIQNILKNPDYYITSYQTLSSEHNLLTSKQGYLYLLEKKTLGSSTRVKQYCKYYKEIKKLEVIPFNQTTNKPHQTEVYYVNNCQKSSSDKRFVFDVSLREKGYNNIHTYQALSYEDYKAWFAIMDGKELTPVLSNYSIKTDPIYILDRNGISFIKRCISLLEDEKIKEEGIYRKNGVSHKINIFIEKNFLNLLSSTLVQSNLNNSNSNSNCNNSSNDNLSNSDHNNMTTNSSNNNNNNGNQNNHVSSSFIQTVLKSANISHSPSFSTLSILGNSPQSNDNTNNSLTNQSGLAPQNNSINLVTHTSNSNLVLNGSDTEDTCTITSALKHYLIHLKEPIMTFLFNHQFLAACRKENINERVLEIHKLLHSLPVLNFEALELIMKHLNKVSKFSHLNKMTTSNLATCFGPTLFRTEQECVSNLYNIKFYSEIVELLIINHEYMFQPNLDQSFLGKITPIKTPPTMLTGTMTSLNNQNGSSSLQTSNSKNKQNNVLTANLLNKRVYDPNSNLNVLMNSSKTSVSSDSSQSDKEYQLNSSLITSPLTTSSPTQVQRVNNNESSTTTISVTSGTLNNLVSTNRTPNLNNTQTPSSSLSSPSTSTISSPNVNGLPNISIPIQSTAPPFISQTIQNNNNNKSINKPTDNLQKIAINNSNINNSTSSSNSNNLTGQNRSSTPSLNSLNNNSNGNKSYISSPLNTRSTIITSNAAPQTTTSMTSLNSNTANFNSPNLSLSLENSPNKLKRARTLYPCEADNPSELSFEANVIIFNVRRSKESGWLEATYNGKSGLVPGNYVQILDD